MTVPSTAAKVPAVTLAFWVVKILATTLGETAGDTLSMSLDLGYLLSTAGSDRDWLLTHGPWALLKAVASPGSVIPRLRRLD